MKGQSGCIDRQERAGYGVLSRLGEGVRKRMARWGELGRQRMLLAQLDDSALKDLGLSRADVYQETERHFWDDPLKRR
jgi:uncharacterized protein YjiS (DUF1127 family)